MIIRVIFLAVLTLFWASSGFSYAADASPEVQRLILQLNAQTAEARDAAEAVLLKLGPGILPELPSEEMLRGGPAETAMRLGRVRLELQKQASANTLLPATILVQDIPPEEKTLAEWLAWLEAQTGNFMYTRPGPGESAVEEKKISLRFSENTLETEELLFWYVLDRLSDAFRVSPQLHAPSAEIFVAPESRILPRTGISPWNPPKTVQNMNVTYAGPFRVAPTKITSTILLDRAAVATQVQTEIAWEPRLTPVFLNVEVTSLAAENRALEILPRTHEVPVGADTVAATLDLPLALKNAEDWGVIHRADYLSLEGKLTAVVAGPRHPFTFTELGKKLGKRIPAESERVAGVLVTFTGIRRDVRTVLSDSPEAEKEKVLVASVRFRYEETHGAMDSHRLWLYKNPAWLVSPTGEKLASTHYEILRQSTNEISLALYFPDAGESLAQWSLVYPRPTGLYAVEYDFRMAEVPSP